MLSISWHYPPGFLQNASANERSERTVINPQLQHQIQREADSENQYNHQKRTHFPFYQNQVNSQHEMYSYQRVEHSSLHPQEQLLYSTPFGLDWHGFNPAPLTERRMDSMAYQFEVQDENLFCGGAPWSYQQPHLEHQQLPNYSIPFYDHTNSIAYHEALNPPAAHFKPMQPTTKEFMPASLRPQYQSAYPTPAEKRDTIPMQINYRRNIDIDDYVMSSEYSKPKQTVDWEVLATADQGYKSFMRQLRIVEKGGFDAVKSFAKKEIPSLGAVCRWKACVEIAEIAKKENYLKSARVYYKKAIQSQPQAVLPWLEYSKLEEECGELQKCEDILKMGLTFCPLNECITIKLMKLEERLGNLRAARSLLGRLRNLDLERTWRIILEGALLEARVGNITLARKIFKYLLMNVPSYISIYLEASLLEERCEEYTRAIQIAQKGLETNPRYGPLWFTLLRLQEKVAYISGYGLDKVRESVEAAVAVVPKELKWKLHFEAAQMEERAGLLERAREAYVKSVAQCPNHLLWKVWLAGARTELRSNPKEVSIARKLIKRSYREAPEKKRSQVLLEWARIEEFSGCIADAREVLTKSRKEAKHEWKVFLESVLLELRAGNVAGARQQAESALQVHAGTGRLWALLIQINQHAGEAIQLKLFKQALQEVPKSGEVWCEGARMYLVRRDFPRARRFLEFAIHFTPQYGDSFIEYLRLELMENGLQVDLSQLELLCNNADPNYGNMWLFCKRSALDSTLQVLRNAKEMLIEAARNPSKPSLLSLDFSKQYNMGFLSLWERWNAIFGIDHIKP